MTRKFTDKTLARIVQMSTGMSYTTCLRLVRGELVLVPAVKECLVEDALRAAMEGMLRDDVERPTTKPCSCSRCAGD